MEAVRSLSLLPLGDLNLLGPAIVLALCALTVLLADLFFDAENKEALPWIAIAGVVSAFVWLHLNGAVPIGEDGHPVRFAFYNCLRFDRLTFLANNVILGLAFFLIFVSPRYLRDRLIPRGEYYVLLLFATMSMMLLASSNELLTLFVNIELLSITLYAMSGSERENLRSTEAAFKYFLMGSYAAAFLLFGLTLVFGATGTTSFNQIEKMVAAGAVQNPLFLVAGLSLMLVGFGFKLTLAPFHMYAPDLYAGAPTPVAAAVATGSKVAGLALFFNFFRLFGSWPDLSGGFYYGFYGLTLASIVIGNIGALVQPNIKRLLAYSGVAHAGYALIPLVAVMHRARTGGPSLMPEAEEAISYYLLAYALTTVLAFGVAATLGPQGESHIDRYAGLARRSPVLAAVLALALLSLTGVPITVGFVGKFYLFSVAIKAGQYFLASAAILMSVASAYYYLRIIVKMYMEEPKGTPAEPAQLDLLNGIALVGGAVGILFFALLPMKFLLE